MEMNKKKEAKESSLKKGPLMNTVRRQSNTFLVTPISEMEEFYIDSPVYDEDDYWADMRPDG